MQQGCWEEKEDKISKIQKPSQTGEQMSEHW